MLFYVSDANYPLRYVSSGHLLSRESFIHPSRLLDTSVLIVVVEGILHIDQEGRRYDVGPNQFVILYAGMHHSGFAPSEGILSYHWVHFTAHQEGAQFIESTSTFQCSQKIGCAPNQVYLLPEYGTIDFASQVILLFSQLLNNAKRNPGPSPIHHYALSHMILKFSQQLLANPGIDSYPLHVAKAIDWIENNYHLPLSAQSIAEYFNYHPNYLSSEIKKHTGMTLIQYLNHVRMDAAKSLLSNYDMKIHDISSLCGYTDEKYFMRIFKKMHGCTPLQYRRMFSLHRSIES